MGAWGIGSLDNDGSLDWLSDFSDFGASAATDVLDAVAEGLADGYLDSDIGTGVVALAEIVSAALGKPDDGLSDQLSEPLDRHKEALLDIDKLQARVSEALDAIMSDVESSELYALWEETDEFDVWAAQIQSLKSRLDTA